MRRPWIIWWAIALHLAWGFALIANSSVFPLAIFVGLHWVRPLGIGAVTVGVLLITAALAAASGLLLDTRISRRSGLLLLMPQYAILLAAFVSDTQTVVTGFVDGREIDRVILFVVLWPVMIAAVLHSLAIVERHALWTPR